QIDANHFQVLRGYGFSPEVTGHFLAFEHFTRILTLTGRTVGAVGNGVTVGRTAAVEIPALHRTGKTFTNGYSLNIHKLAGDEVLGGQLRTDFQNIVRGNAEFSHLLLRLDLGGREHTAHRLGCTGYFRVAGA